MDGVGQPRIRRTAVYFLSATFVDAGRGAELCGSVERGAGSFHCHCPDFGWAALVEKSLQPLWRAAGGLALGFALTSFYLLPAAYEQHWVNISQVLSSGLQPADNFLYTQGNDPEHNAFNWIASSVAVLLLVMTGIAGIAALQKTTQGQESDDRKKLWRMLLVLCAAAAI